MGAPRLGDDDLTADELAKGKGLKPSRAIGGTLNALVRATVLYQKGVERFDAGEQGSASDAMRMMAERAAKAMRRARPNAIELENVRLKVGGEVALSADKEHTAWVLYAFMAGVRRIEPRRTMTADDVIRLVQALVALEPSVESIERFRDWIDADGAEGFDVRVHTSFREVFEEVDLEEEREFSKAFAMARFEVPRSGDAVYIAAKDLDKVAMRKEFEVPIEMYTSGAVAAAAGGLSDEALAALGPRCDDGNAWATAELEAVLAVAELRTAVTPEHMARRVVNRLSQEADARFLMLLTTLNARKDPFRVAVARALGTREVGEIIARQLALAHEDAVEAFGKFLVLSPPVLASAVVSGLLDRSTDDSVAKSATLLLAEWYGSAQFSSWVLAPSLSRETAVIVGQAFSRGALDPADVTRLVGATPVEAGLALLGALPQQQLVKQGRTLHLLWGRAEKGPDKELSEGVAELMVKSGAPESLKLLGDLLLGGRLARWPGRVIYALCRGLLEHDLGRTHVLPLALDQRADEQLRIIALECLQGNAELAAEASRFRFSRLFDSAAVRERMKKLAQVAKSGRQA